MSDQIWITFHDERIEVEHKQTPKPNRSTILYWFLGCVLGGVGYIYLALFLERHILPMLEPPENAYGSALMFSHQICVVISGFLGIGIALWRKNRVDRALKIFGLTFLFGTIWLLFYWLPWGIGSCSSELIIFYPPATLCAVCFVLMLLARGSLAEVNGTSTSEEEPNVL